MTGPTPRGRPPTPPLVAASRADRPATCEHDCLLPELTVSSFVACCQLSGMPPCGHAATIKTDCEHGTTVGVSCHTTRTAWGSEPRSSARPAGIGTPRQGAGPRPGPPGHSEYSAQARC